MTDQHMLPTRLSEDMIGQEYFVWFNDSLFYARACKSIWQNDIVLAGKSGIDTITIFGRTGIELKIFEISGQYAYRFEHGLTIQKEDIVSAFRQFYQYYDRFAPERY